MKFQYFGYYLIGILNVNVDPLTFLPSSFRLLLLLIAHIFPSCISIILLQINNPKPVPPIIEELVANFVKSFGNISGSIPIPVSFILIRISSLLLILLPFFFQQ
jgi:hypothetical protein